MRKMKKLKPGKYHRAVLTAFKLALKKAEAEHRRNGVPMVVWKDGRMVKIPAKDL